MKMKERTLTPSKRRVRVFFSEQWLLTPLASSKRMKTALQDDEGAGCRRSFSERWPSRHWRAERE
jgi:hypothetical protein